MINMYLKDNRGEMRHWAIWYDEDEIIIRHGLYKGSMQTKKEKVIVKGNNNLMEQIQSRIASRCSKQRDKGYVPSLAQAMKGRPTNAIDMPKPMLAHPLKNAVVTGDYFTQFKYDGHRCLIAKKDDKIFAYSRNGKPITTIPHILEQLELNMQNGMILDGELYIHGLSLQKIASLVKRKQPQSANLQYMLYDIMIDETYRYRLDIMLIGFKKFLVPTHYMGSYDLATLTAAKDAGYEGLIVRLDDRGYEDGKRSKSLIKIKQFDDDEFKVVGIHASVDNWAILECITEKGIPFNVSAPGSIMSREYILQHSHEYIGRDVRVEYANITKDGVPFHPVATNFRLKAAE